MAKRETPKRPQRSPRLVISTDYEDITLTFFHVVAMGLDATLQDAKVKDVKLRRRIVDDFLFEFADFLDEQWLQDSDGKRYFPILCFSEQHPDDDPKAIGYAPNQAYHECMPGVFDEVTNRGKGPYNVKIGYVGDDEALDLK
jgi:hypothetical protein